MSDEKSLNVSLPENPPPAPRDKPQIRKPIFNKPILNPLLEIDWDKIETKQEAFLIGYINGQNARGR
jgi:hypothetical protein